MRIGLEGLVDTDVDVLDYGLPVFQLKERQPIEHADKGIAC